MKLTTFVLYNPTLLKIEEDFDTTTFADFDAEVIAVQPPPSDAEIVAELLETKGVSDNDDNYPGEIVDEPVKCLDKNDLLQVLQTLQRFSLLLDKDDTIQSYASRIESQVNITLLRRRRSKRPLGTF